MHWILCKLVLFFIFTFHLLIASAQGYTYPVHITVKAVPPYSLYLSDYVSGSRDRFLVTLLNRDLRYGSMPVRLRLSVKGNGFSIQTRPYASVPPLSLDPNVPYRLSIEELRPYFDPRNLSASGLGSSGILKGSRLPEGPLEFSIEALEYHTGRALSTRSATLIYLSLQKPPSLLLPNNEEVIASRDPLNLLFQWHPQHRAGQRVEYELILKELWDNGLRPEAAFPYSPEIYRERLPTPRLAYGAMHPPLQPGRRYAWAVQAVALDGLDELQVFENNGLSEIRTFRIARDCPGVRNLRATPLRGRVAIEWEGDPRHLGYTILYRPQGEQEWLRTSSSFPSTSLTGVREGHTYEYRIGAACEADLPIFGDISSVTLPSEDTTYDANCGKMPQIDLSNREPIATLAPGDQFMAADFPITIMEISGGNGRFSGTGHMNLPFFGNARIRVRFDNILINTDRRMIEGYTEAVYNDRESGLADMDEILHGGGMTGHVVEGITKAGIDVDFSIPEGSAFFADGQGNISVRDEEGNVLGYIEASRLPGTEETPEGGVSPPSIFPMTLKDRDGNLYLLEDTADNATDNRQAPPGERQLAATRIGRESAPLPADSVNYELPALNMGEVRFRNIEGSRYAFDAWEDIYQKSAIIREHYKRFGHQYYVPFKLLPPGKSEEVEAELTVHREGIDPAKVIFMTPQGSVFKSLRDGNRYRVTLVGGRENDAQEVYALHPRPGGGYYNLGKLLVVSYPSYRAKVTFVPVNNPMSDQDLEGMKRKLSQVYGPVGIEWEVTRDEVFHYGGELDLFGSSSGLPAAYTDAMKALNGAYAGERGTDRETCYVFLLRSSGRKADRHASGFMPRRKQYGYLFSEDFGRDREAWYTAAAHELGHGRFSQEHPFGKVYGLPQGATSNLMDYSRGTHLAKWQWDVIYDPGIVIRIFDRDGDAMIAGAFYDGIGFIPLVNYKYGYDFNDIFSVESQGEEIECGKYTIKPHYNVDIDGSKKLSFYVAWCEVEERGTKTVRLDYYIGGGRLKEFQDNIVLYTNSADLFFMNGVPSENMLRTLSGMQERKLGDVMGGLGDMWCESLIDPMWWIGVVNSTVVPKFMKPAGKLMGDFSRSLTDGAVKLLNKAGKLGCKIKHVTGEVALYINLEYEIARFNSKGVIRPLYWGEAIGEKILVLDDNIHFLKDNKELYGKLAVYKSGNQCIWSIESSSLAYKVGDKIAGITIERIKYGSNDKIAIIGRAMGNETMKGVKDVYKELVAKGYNNVEIFDEISLKGQWEVEYKQAIKEMREHTKRWTKWLNNQEISQTKLYELNKRWAQKLKDEGYHIIDLGDIPAKEGSYRGFSPFYAIEKKIIFE